MRIIHKIPRVLIIEKDRGRSVLSRDELDGFEIYKRFKIMEVFDEISKIHPDIIMLDANMDGLTGYEVLRRLKKFHKTEKIPVVLIGEIFEDLDPTSALLDGAIDFIIKPISPSLLAAKLSNYAEAYNNILLLKEQKQAAKEANPNTGLPGNNTIRKKVIESLENEERSVVVYADLDNFKAFNDKYGFGNGDDVIKLTGEIISDALKLSEHDTFLGHVGGDDFVFIVAFSDVKKVTDNIISTFDEKVREHYDPEDVAKGSIISKNRRGEVQEFPIMTISLAGVNLAEHDSDTRYEKIADVCAEVKKYAKKFDRSCFYIDRRGGK